MAARIPAALRAHLGDDATFAMIELLDSERRDWSQQVLSTAADRFERRLSEDLGKFREDMIRELAVTRVETLKWSFVFWIGQVAAVAALLAYMRP
jgi:hypothetical protein